MTATDLILVLALLAIAAGILARFAVELLAWRHVTTRAVVVVLDSGQSFSGVLWAQRGPLLTIRQAIALSTPEGQTQVDGELVVERARVAWLQVL